jgi:hypothetical protein
LGVLPCWSVSTVARHYDSLGPASQPVDSQLPWVKDILQSRHVTCRAQEGSRVEWEILLTPQVEAFLDELYESDPVSHQLVNQAILVLERNGAAEGRRWLTRSPRRGLPT